MSRDEKKKLWKQNSDFLTTPEFFNSLPAAPSGPYFKAMSITNFDKYSAFGISTLEKSYTWQPHFPEGGVKLDLVDQESVLIPDKIPQIHLIDAKYLNGNDSGNRKKRKVSSDEKPWWLRNTIYLENNLYNQRRPAVKDEKDRVLKDQSTKHIDTYTPSAIEDSFIKISKSMNYIENLKRSKVSKTECDIEWSIPIFPNSLIFQNPLLPVLFDEDIKDIIEKRNNLNGTRYNVTSSIITNARRPQKGDIQINEKSFNISLIAPDGDIDGNGEGTQYDWISDFKMELQYLASAEDEFLIEICPPSKENSNSDEDIYSAKYWPVSKRIELRKLPVDEATPHQAIVYRISDL
jgi:hypothetical protein